MTDMSTNVHRFQEDSVVAEKWRNMSENESRRPYKLWEFFSAITTGTTLLQNQCASDVTKTDISLDYQALIPDLNHGSTDLPNSSTLNFAAKLNRVLFPVNRPFFTLDVPKKTLEQLGIDEIKAQQSVERSVEGIMDILLTKKLNVVTPDMFEHDTVMGNSLLFMGLSVKDPIRFISPADYVVRRTRNGDLRELIIRDVIAIQDIRDEELQKVLIENGREKAEFGPNKEANNPNLQEPDSVQQYMYVRFDEQGNQEISMYVDQYKVGGTMRKSWREPCFIVSSPNRPKASWYGMGKTKDALNSILQVRNSTLAFNNINNLLAAMKIAVTPDAVDAVKTSASENGATAKYVPLNDPKDMQVMSWGSNISMESPKISLEEAKREIAKIYLSDSGATRNAERVTAEEIKYLAEELDANNSDLVTAYADQVQEKLVMYGMYHLKLENQKGEVLDRSELMKLKIRVITGTEAIGKISESDNIKAALQGLTVLNNVPEDVRSILQVKNIARAEFTNRGLQSTVFTKTDEVLQAEQEAAKKAEEERAAREAMSNAMNNGQGPNTGPV